MFLCFCYKGFHWPTRPIIVIMAEGKEDKNAEGGGGVAKKN